MVFPSYILTMLFYVALAGVPAWLINKSLMSWLKPKESARNFVLYVLAAFSAAIIYTFLFCLILVKFVYTH